MKKTITILCVCVWILLPLTGSAGQAQNGAGYCIADESQLSEMARLTPEYVLDGFYDAYIECAPYIVAIEVIDNLYSYGEVRCLIEGLSANELRTMLEKSFGFSMKKAQLGYYCEMEEGTYDLNKVNVEVLRDQIFLTMQDADFSMVEAFKRPAFYLNRLGEAAFNYQPANSVVAAQSVAFNFSEGSLSFSCQYMLPNQDRQTIAEDYFNGFYKMDGYYYVENPDWTQQFHNIRKSDAITVTTDYADEAGSLIVQTIHFKEPAPLDSSALAYMHSLVFEDFYSDLCKKTLPVIGGEVVGVSISQHDMYSFAMITEAPELMNQTARDVSITEVNIAAAGDVDVQLMEYMPVASILNALGGAEVYVDGERLLLYRDDAFVIRMYREQDDNGAAYVVCTFVEINSPMYENVGSLAVMDALPALNVYTDYEPTEEVIVLREADDETLFTIMQFYGLENADKAVCDAFISQYKAYFESMGVEYYLDEMDGQNCLISYAEQSDLYPGIMYETRVFAGGEDAMVYLSIEVEKCLEEEYLN